ncbi:MAG: hypothetical protein A4E53_03825 [Pelotomaculum sp. PtaB.Bin104]|nr:MAG: hypothetical protein A4E53_03825 [Pelotomaculum sp. PtaB.Bin104]
MKDGIILISSLFEHRGSDMLAREQASFYIHDAQKGTVEMGKLLQQIASAGASQSEFSQQCAKLLQLNAQVGENLVQAQGALK